VSKAETMPYPVIISACLAGLHTRYDGASRPHSDLKTLAEKAVLVPVCPEILGGLGIPRTACNFVGGDGEAVLLGNAGVIDRNGIDRTQAFVKAAHEVERIVQLVHPKLIIFKEGSPSCGVRRVDIEGVKQEGCGVTTALLKPAGITIISEEDVFPEIS
jgi:uncharacterized protein YbbK (DUF523 family)